MSLWQHRRVFLVLMSLTGVVMLAFLDLWQQDQPHHQSTDWCRVRSQLDTFTLVPGTKTLLVNAFREHRTDNASVRLLGIVLREEDSLGCRCVFCCQREGEVVTVAAERTIHDSHYYFPYGTGDFLCQIPFGCKPRCVGLVSGNSEDLANISFLPVLNQHTPARSRLPLKYTLCMPTLFNNYNNVLQFVQAMELYKLLGIQRAIIYKTSCSATMELVLKYYSSKVLFYGVRLLAPRPIPNLENQVLPFVGPLLRNLPGWVRPTRGITPAGIASRVMEVHKPTHHGKVGFLQVVPWPIDSHLKPSSSWLLSLSPGEIHYWGQIPSNNDCVYRSMYLSRYVLMHDPDEVIMPTGNVSFEMLMSDLEKAHGENVHFYFPNNVFPNEEKDENSRYDLPEWRHLTGNNFLVHTLKEQGDWGTGKLVLDPRSVLQMNVHFVQRHFHGGRTHRVGPELARLYHVRRRKDSKQKRSDLVRDEGLLRLGPALVQRVNHALSCMGLLLGTAGEETYRRPLIPGVGGC